PSLRPMEVGSGPVGIRNRGSRCLSRSQRADSPRAGSARQEATAGGKAMQEATPTVFVVDDEASVRKAIARLLCSAGLHVETFASAHEFLRSPQPVGPACLVLDMRLSGENGLIVQDVLRQQERCLPIIFLTGHGTVPLCAKAL